MSGHNKWSQIKHRKGAADAAKSNTWGKLAKRIIVESKLAHGDVTSPTLRTWIEKARKANMPKDNIERAVQKGVSPDAGSMETVLYETYGPGGCAILISAVTDSRNRTAQEIKHLLSKNGLSLANPGSALWAFEKNADGEYVAKTTVPLSDADSGSLMKILDALGDHDDVENVYTNAA